MQDKNKTLGNYATRCARNGVGTNFGVGGRGGVEEARPERPRAGDGVLGEGTANTPHKIGFCGSAVSSHSGSGAEPRPRKGFLVF